MRLHLAALSVLTLALSVSLGASCGGSDSANLPCDLELKGLCGAACTSNIDCPHGTHCGESATCWADCSASVPCPPDQTCNGSGECVPGGTSGLDGGNPFDVSIPDVPVEGCADVHVTFDQQIPTVILLVDQSGSMTAGFGGGNRWDVLRDSLMDPATGVVAQLESAVRFGLTLYTSTDQQAQNGQCPDLTEVPPKLNNYNDINAVYQGADPIEDTPTGDSLQVVTTKLLPYPEPGPKVIVLATDGEPDTCAVPDPQNGQPEAIAAAQAAHAAGIETYILSVGADVSQGHLQDMANAGKGLPINGPDNAPFWMAFDQQGLLDAFLEIINGVRTCIFTLNGKVDLSKAAEGKVVLDGKELVYNDPNGWTLVDESTLELLGTACDTIQDGKHQLDVTFPCGSVTPPN